MDAWNRGDNPVVRLRLFMEKKGWWDDAMDADWKKKTRVDVLKAFNRAETRKKPAIRELFTDVYDQLPKQLEDQQKEMLEMVAKYPDAYPLAAHVDK